MVFANTTASPGTRGRPLQHPAFRWYLFGTSVSQLGNSVAPVALAFAVLSFSGSTYDLGLVLTARSVPLVVFLLIGGVVADRFPRTTVLIVANAGAGLTQGVSAFLLITGRAGIGALVGLAALNGALGAFSLPAMRGIVPRLVQPDERQRANALLGLSRSAAQVLGPALSGAMFAVVGGGWAVAVDAATFACAACCALMLPRTSAKPARGRRGPWADLREGWSTFHGISWLWKAVCSLCIANLLVAGTWGVLGPAIAATTIGAGAWGLVLGARAVGLFLTTALVYRIRIARLLLVAQVGFAVTALPLLALGLWPALPVLLVTSFAAGLGSGVFSPVWQTLLQDQIPEHQLSRVSAYDDLGASLAVPLGQVLAGPVAGALGEQPTAAWAGVAFLIAVLAPLASRSVREVRALSQ
ncbi:MFS transporter [Streptomyces chattanoogensis]|uniref:Major facilitator superfamily (MFS) profile domain-containing protein n=1 Tax=Streptomyces chattanoogensis TaxID=66876 RepID=A0A0N0XYU5_9ACTN|nr:MFS transporter [Streptomyces chattanoogensis]KPC64366.1 hypothetical protein ADL29_12730 [Streptomyces chattanoogensis]